MRCNSVSFLRKQAHELDAATGHDECGEAVLAQILKQLEHRLINNLRVRSLELRMLRRRQPFAHDSAELFGGHAGVRRHRELGDSFDALRHYRFHVARELRFERFSRLPFRMLRQQGLQPIVGEECLHRCRHLAPECPVVIEHGDALVQRDELSPALARHAIDEVDNGLLGCTVIPRCKRLRHVVFCTSGSL